MLRFTCQFVHRSFYPSGLISHHIIAVNHFIAVNHESFHPSITNRNC